MKTIFKYSIPIEDEFSLLMPIGAEILCVQVQRETPCIWAVVEQSAWTETRIFEIRGTGHAFRGDEGKYIGTFQLHDGHFIGHLFERKP